MSKSSKVAIITGGAVGLGKRTAIELSKRGINIVINYVNSQEEAFQLAQDLADNYGVKAIALKGDISVFEECRNVVTKTMNMLGRIDILINNAGPYMFDRKSLVDYEVNEWDYLVAGNLNAAFYLCKLVIPVMRNNKWGRIINFGFERAETAPGWVFRSAFAASKVGLVSLTKTLAIEEAEHGITVNMVCPGEIVGEWKEADIEDARLSSDDPAPIGRIGSGEDIARVISFLCEEDSDFITGSIIPITGGKDVLSKRINTSNKLRVTE